MTGPLLEIDGLGVRVEEKDILRDIHMTIAAGETHVLMGPNGAGKSTLGYALMGNPRYEITGGRVLLEGKEITHAPADQRARDGLFLSFQEPLEIPGLTLEQFLRSAVQQRTGQRIRLWEFRRSLQEAMAQLQLDPGYASRDLNVGFSGGEKKKIEILQLLIFQPKLAILDETDSGLDVDAVRTVSQGIRLYQQSQKGALLIITHSTRILDALPVNRTHVMVDGQIVAEGDGTLVEQINRSGYEPYLAARRGGVGA